MWFIETIGWLMSSEDGSTDIIRCPSWAWNNSCLGVPSIVLKAWEIKSVRDDWNAYTGEKIIPISSIVSITKIEGE
jgi:hypothetical protein